MSRPNLVDTRVYHKFLKKFTKSNNNHLSYKFNIAIVVFMCMGLLLIYGIYLDKSEK